MFCAANNFDRKELSATCGRKCCQQSTCCSDVVRLTFVCAWPSSAVLCCCLLLQMDQKHAVEDVLLDAGLPGLMLEATMFMEEFWKKYTRPGLLKGSFTFSLPGGAAQQQRVLVTAGHTRVAGTESHTEHQAQPWVVACSEKLLQNWHPACH
jgi:hypothetical protein